MIKKVCVAVFLAVCLLLGGTSNIQPHQHHFETVYQIEATCSKFGSIFYRCSCGEQRREIIPPTGQHKYVSTVIKQATYKEAGQRKYTCSICKKYYIEAIPRIIRKIDVSTKQSCYLFDHLSVDEQQLISDILAEYDKIRQSNSADEFIFAKVRIISQNIREQWYLQQRIAYTLTYAYGTDAEYRLYPTVIQVDNINDDWIATLRISVEELAKIIEIGQINKQRCIDIVETLQDGTDLEIVKQIFNYHDTHFKYFADYGSLNLLLVNKKGSCNASAQFIRTCCTLCGIKCDIIVGYHSNDKYHAWNRIWIDGRWTYWDATSKKYRNLSKSPFTPKRINYRTSWDEEAERLPLRSQQILRQSMAVLSN